MKRLRRDLSIGLTSGRIRVPCGEDWRSEVKIGIRLGSNPALDAVPRCSLNTGFIDMASEA